MDTEAPRVDTTVGQVLAPFVFEHHRRAGEDLDTVADVVAGDYVLIVLALLYAELPAVAEDAAQASTWPRRVGCSGVAGYTRLRTTPSCRPLDRSGNGSSSWSRGRRCTGPTGRVQLWGTRSVEHAPPTSTCGR